MLPAMHERLLDCGLYSTHTYATHFIGTVYKYILADKSVIEMAQADKFTM